jgi:hypothetical protein
MRYRLRTQGKLVTIKPPRPLLRSRGFEVSGLADYNTVLRNCQMGFGRNPG